MIGTFSIANGPGKRTISYGDKKEWVAVTAGDGSYVSEANVEFGSTKCHVLIGRYCSIGHRVIFEVGLNHDYHCVTTYPFEDFERNDPEAINHAYSVNRCQIIIGNDVWIGCDVTIMGGVRIGNGAVIGAGAVVAKDVPPYAIVVGNPARVIKYRFESDVIQCLQKIKWWYWPSEEIKKKYPLMKNVTKFLAKSKDFHFDESNDETIQALKALKADGYHIYYIYADFQMPDAVWRNVLTEYLKKYSDTSKVLLVLEVTGEKCDEYVADMSKMVDSRGDDAPIVLTHKTNNVISPELLHLVDTFITTKDEPSSVVVDFLSDSDTKIVYGMDFGGHIFDLYS